MLYLHQVLPFARCLLTGISRMASGRGPPSASASILPPIARPASACPARREDRPAVLAHNFAPRALTRGVCCRSGQTVSVTSALRGCLDGSHRHPGTVSGRRSRRIRSRITRKSLRGTATSAIWGPLACLPCVSLTPPGGPWYHPSKVTRAEPRPWSVPPDGRLAIADSLDRTTKVRDLRETPDDVPR